MLAYIYYLMPTFVSVLITGSRYEKVLLSFDKTDLDHPKMSFVIVKTQFRKGTLSKIVF